MSVLSDLAWRIGRRLKGLAVGSQMSRFEHFKFHSYTWSSADEDTAQGKQVIIRIYGWNERLEPTYIRVEDFLLPIIIEIDETIEWTEGAIHALCNRLQELNRNPHMRPRTIVYEERERSYYAYVKKLAKPNPKSGRKYEHKKFPYLMALFPSIEACGRFAADLKRDVDVPGVGKVRLRCHAAERTITPVLKFLGIRELPSAGWTHAAGIKLTRDEQESTRQNEYCMSFQDITAMTPEESMRMPIPQPKVMSFDGEANSTHTSSMPKAHRPGDKMFQIGYTILDPPKAGRPKQYRKELITMGNPDPIEGVKMYKVRNEGDVYKTLAEKMVEEDPEVVVGYNILGWDINYMIERAENMCSNLSELDLMGCIMGKHAPKAEISWGSSGAGKNVFKYLDVEGRVFIDLLPYVKRSYKLPNYRLETVCDEFLKTNKDPIKPKDIFKAWRKYLASLDNPDNDQLRQEANEDLARIGKYCCQDSFVCLLLYEKLNVWADLTESATVCQVPMFDMFTKGQQIKMYSQVYRYSFHNGITVESNAYQAKDDEHYTGAYVSEPIKGLYDMIVPFDFCLSGDTLISLANGSSKRLKDMTPADSVLALNSDHKLVSRSIGPLQLKGRKETVKIWMSDGTSVIATPDHKFFVAPGEWVPADNLKGRQIFSGIVPPTNSITEEDQDWTLTVSGFRFDLREKKDLSLAFTRMLGYILGDGSIYTSGGRSFVEVAFGTRFDAIAFREDIGRFCDRIPTIRKREPEPYTERAIKGTTYCISIPAKLAKLIHSVPGIIVGKRSTQAMRLPDFLIHDDTPLCLLREFVGGLYGADGTSPSFTARSHFTSASFKWTTIERFNDAMTGVFHQLQRIHTRLGINTGAISTIKVKYGKDSIRPKDVDSAPRWDHRLGVMLESMPVFSSSIGFKYCINKSLKACVVGEYVAMCDRIRSQHDRVNDLANRLIEQKIGNVFARKGGSTFASCLDEARENLVKDEPALTEWSLSSTKDLGYERGESKRHANKPRKRSLGKIVKPADFIRGLGVMSWFETYPVGREDLIIPSMLKLIVDVRPSTVQEVFDIEVENDHCFLANGVVAHNCSLYPSIMMAYNIDYSKLVVDPSIPDEDCWVMAWEEHQYCLAEGTPVATADGMTIPIEQLRRHRKVLANDEKTAGVVVANQTNFFDRGVKDCVELTLEDGTKLTCTADHKILQSDGQWQEAATDRLRHSHQNLGTSTTERPDGGDDT